MLFSTLNPVDGVPVGSHRLVTQLLKGCYNLNPPRPKYNSTWDPEVVLEFFREAGENEYLPIKSLAAKRVTLLALTSLLRVSEIASIERSSVVIRPDGATFLLGKPRLSIRVPYPKFLYHHVPTNEFAQYRYVYMPVRSSPHRAKWR